jgi:hypothetical protein
MAEPEELVTDSPIVERNRTHLNPAENALITNLLRPGASIEAVIPDGATPDELWRTLDACVRGLTLLEARLTRLKPIIGKILLVFEQKPSLYKELGYDTYSDFMQKGVYERLGLHRTSAYEGKLAARDFPQLTPDRYVQIGPKKLNVIATAGIKGNNANAETVLQVAATMKVDEFKQYMTARQFIAPGEADGATLTIQTNRNRMSLFNAFFNDARIRSVVGSKDKDRILEAAIQEVHEEWVARHEAEREARRHETENGNRA